MRGGPLISDWWQSRIRLCTLSNAADRTPLRALRDLFPSVCGLAPLPECESLSRARVFLHVSPACLAWKPKQRAIEGTGYFTTLVTYNPLSLDLSHTVRIIKSEKGGFYFFYFFRVQSRALLACSALYTECVCDT